ncbi:MAG: extracellular solute-binding protein, partial [Gammaproteobacteria bacterium]|nr:extracellular solute-binding protein [Gammaproteobacteria bacterium]
MTELKQPNCKKYQTIEDSRRRKFLAASATAVAGISLSGFPMLSLGQSRPLKVGAYGGYFKDSFDQFIFPEFTKETGIEVESIAEPTGEAWLAQLNAAASAGQAPADVSMIAQVPMLKGQKTELWMPLDEGKLPNLANVSPNFVHRYPDGRLDGVGAVAWYITLVTNTDVYSQEPESWDELWNPANKDRLGLLALVTNSFLLEITSTTYYGTTDILNDEAGQLEVFGKLAELKDNVALWYRDEAQFEQALKSGEIPMGQYYHDVAGLAAADGFTLRTPFPRDGGA